MDDVPLIRLKERYRCPTENNRGLPALKDASRQRRKQLGRRIDEKARRYCGGRRDGWRRGRACLGGRWDGGSRRVKYPHNDQLLADLQDRAFGEVIRFHKQFHGCVESFRDAAEVIPLFDGVNERRWRRGGRWRRSRSCGGGRRSRRSRSGSICVRRGEPGSARWEDRWREEKADGWLYKPEGDPYKRKENQRSEEDVRYPGTKASRTDDLGTANGTGIICGGDTRATGGTAHRMPGLLFALCQLPATREAGALLALQFPPATRANLAANAPSPSARLNGHPTLTEQRSLSAPPAQCRHAPRGQCPNSLPPARCRRG